MSAHQRRRDRKRPMDPCPELCVAEPRGKAPLLADQARPHLPTTAIAGSFHRTCQGGWNTPSLGRYRKHSRTPSRSTPPHSLLLPEDSYQVREGPGPMKCCCPARDRPETHYGSGHDYGQPSPEPRGHRVLPGLLELLVAARWLLAAPITLSRSAARRLALAAACSCRASASTWPWAQATACTGPYVSRDTAIMITDSARTTPKPNRHLQLLATAIHKHKGLQASRVSGRPGYAGEHAQAKRSRTEYKYKAES